MLQQAVRIEFVSYDAAIAGDFIIDIKANLAGKIREIAVLIKSIAIIY